MTELSERFFNMIVSKGVLMRYTKNDVIWTPPETTDYKEQPVSGGDPCERTGIFIVIAGLVSRSFKEANGKSEVRSFTLASVCKSDPGIDIESSARLQLVSHKTQNQA